MKRPNQCPICNAPFGIAQQYLYDFGYDVVQCSQCILQYIHNGGSHWWILKEMQTYRVWWCYPENKCLIQKMKNGYMVVESYIFDGDKIPYEIEDFSIEIIKVFQ